MPAKTMGGKCRDDRRAQAVHGYLQRHLVPVRPTTARTQGPCTDLGLPIH